ncbi:MAG: hypothetical protein ACHQFX_10890, partial [Chitinophagales bacterium]
FRSHNEFGKDWTSKYRPWKLLHQKEFELRHDALQYEKWLKTGAGRDFYQNAASLSVGFISAAADSLPDFRVNIQKRKEAQSLPNGCTCRIQTV